MVIILSITQILIKGRILSLYFWCLIAALSYSMDISLDIPHYMQVKIRVIKDLLK